MGTIMSVWVRSALAFSLASAALSLPGQAPAAPAAAGQAGGNKPVAQRVSCTVDRTEPSAAEYALSRDENEVALGLFQKMSADKPEQSRAGVIRALLGQDKVVEANKLADTWLAEKPQDPSAMQAKAEVLLRQASIPEAFGMELKVCSLNACEPRAFLIQGEIDDLAGLFASGKAALEQAHRMAPNQPEIRRAWISTLSRKQRLAEYAAMSGDTKLLNDKDRGQMAEYIANAKENPAPECTVTSAAEGATIPIQKIMDGPYHQVGLALDVQFNGKRRRLELDTGASGLLISRSAAGGLGLVREEKRMTGGVGDQGNVVTSVAHVESVKIGKLEFHNCQVEILEKKSALDIDGLIGADVFRKYLVTIDFPKAEVKLDALPPRPGEKPATKSLDTGEHPVLESGAETSENEEPVAHDRYMAPEMQDWTKIYRTGHMLLIPVGIGDASGGLFLVDTGAGLMSITPEAAAPVTKVKKDYSGAEVSGISGKVNQLYYTGHFLFRFAHLAQKVDEMTAMSTTNLSHNAGVEISGFLGAPILDRLTVHIDYRDNLIKFDYDPRN